MSQVHAHVSSIATLREFDESVQGLLCRHGLLCAPLLAENAAKPTASLTTALRTSCGYLVQAVLTEQRRL
jgi:hypothetical protein